MKCTVSHYIAICLFGSENYIILFLPWFLIKISFDVINFEKYTGIQNLSNDGGYLEGGITPQEITWDTWNSEYRDRILFFFKWKKHNAKMNRTHTT